jgi:hypothetical protein
MGYARIRGSLTSRVGQPVRFGAPKDVDTKKGAPAHGEIIDEVWADMALNSSPPHPQPCQGGDHCWGDYSFCAQLIQWKDGHDNDKPGEPSVRLAYYRRRCGEDWWEYASQMTVTADCATVKALLEVTLAKTKWFCP